MLLWFYCAVWAHLRGPPSHCGGCAHIPSDGMVGSFDTISSYQLHPHFFQGSTETMLLWYYCDNTLVIRVLPICRPPNSFPSPPHYFVTSLMTHDDH